MIIDTGPDKDIEAQRGGPSNARPTHIGSSASASAVASSQYESTQTEPANESDRLLGGSDSPPGTYPDAQSSNVQIGESSDPPPAFTPYEAEWFEIGHEDVVSHDEHLNTDGEALYRFLLTQASQRPPRYRIHCRGTHNETRYRFVTSHDNDSHRRDHHNHSNGSSTRTESYTERVTDFDFYIDVTPPLSCTTPAPVDAKMRDGQSPDEETNPTHRDGYAPIHWSVADNEPAYRGKMVREVEIPVSGGRGPVALPDGDHPLSSISQVSSTNTQLRRATRKEREDYTQWIKQCTDKGLPPWAYSLDSNNSQWSQVNMVTSPDGFTPTLTPSSILRSSKTVRQWADSYCSSPKLLKEFIFTKIPYGWDLAQLRSAIHSTIALAPYHGEIEVNFTPVNSRIYIRPSNRLSRMLSNGWLKFISIILLIFPFIWLFKRFHSRGGGKWQVCGSAYALKRWVPLNSSPSPASQSQHEAPMMIRSSSSLPDGSSGLPTYEDTVGPSTLGLSPSLPSSSSAAFISTTTTQMSFPVPHPNPQTRTRIIQTSSGPYKFIGQREGEWFRYWEPIILRAVLMRYQSSAPLTSHNELYGRHGGPGSTLEGYHDTPLVGPGVNVDVAPTSNVLDGYNLPNSGNF